MNTIIAPPEETEYAVRYRMPGDLEDTLTAVGSPEIGADVIRDIETRYGVSGALVSRTVTAWQVAQ